jgi:hypothetical protein
VSGLSAAHTIYLAGGNVLLLDKNGECYCLLKAPLTRAGFMGGNSTKATSGINGALTRTQVDLKIDDSVKQFYDDTLKSARDKARPELIKVLTYKSAAAVEWLMDEFNLDLTLVSRLGYAFRFFMGSLTSIVATPSRARTVAMMPSSLAWPSRTRSWSVSSSCPRASLSAPS